MFDNTRVRAEIDHIQRALSEVMAQPHGATLLVELHREIDRPIHTLLRQALLADCVRLAVAAVTADGMMREPQVDAVREFMSAAALHYAATLPVTYREAAGIDAAAMVRTFLYRYAADGGAFGQRAVQHWPGLELCREAEHLRHPEARQRYTRLMGWLLSEARQLAAGRGNGWANRGDIIAELSELLGNPPAPMPDPALQMSAFLSPTRVFSHVQYASSVFEADPFDVDSIYASARHAFARVLDQAAMPPPPSSTGWMLLLLGDSGSGKTHLLRSFRHHVQEHGLGFAAYAPLHTDSDDHARYLLQQVVDSLTRPYAGSSSEHTGLYELASGVIRIAPEPLRSELLQLTEGKWEVAEGADTFAAYVHRLADQLQRHTTLGTIDCDLVRTMLFSLYPAPGMISRVYRYLRCVDMSLDDRQWLGNIVPRTGPHDPTWMIRDLARFAFVTRRAPFVIMVDQAERAIVDPIAGGAALARVVETLHGIVSEVPSVVAVVSYIDDVYSAIRHRLTGSVIDRIEVNPPPIRLSTPRSYAEIEAMISRRLAWLYAGTGAVYRPEAPVYPFPEHELKKLNGYRTRDVLAWCQRFQRQCVAAGRIIDEVGSDEEPGVTSGTDLRPIATAWARAIAAPHVELPESEEEILDLLAQAAADCSLELGLTSQYADATRDNLSAIRISLTTRNAARIDIVIGWTHRDPRAGAFGAQLTTLRKAARGAVPVAVRRGSFPRGTASERAMTTLRSAGGRCVSLDDATLRTLVAARHFQPVWSPERFLSWRQLERPISSLPVLAEILDLARLTAVSVGTDRADEPDNDYEGEPTTRAPRPKRRTRVASQNRRKQPTV